MSARHANWVGQGPQLFSKQEYTLSPRREGDTGDCPSYRSFLARITALAALFAVGGSSLIGCAAHLRTSDLPRLMYVRTSATSREVVARPLSSPKLHVVYRARGASSARTEIPGEFGFLPSPGGRRVLVWDGVDPGRDRPSGRTKWVVVDTSNGHVRTLGETEGVTGLLPHWSDDDRLVLTGHQELSVNLAGRDSEHTLPQPIPPDDAFAAMLAYGRRYHARELKSLARIGAHASEMDLESYMYGSRLAQPEYSVLRATGVPFTPAWQYQLPHLPQVAVAVSPDGRKLAFTDLWSQAPPITVDDHGQKKTVQVYGGRVVVYDLVSGVQAYAIRVPPKPRKLPGSGLIENPPRLPWTHPWLGDIRWSRDQKYLSYTEEWGESSSIVVLSTSSWKEVLRLPGAADAFVISRPGN